MNDYVSLNTLIEVIDGIPCIVNMKFQTGFGSYNCKFSQLDISIEDIYVIFTDRETVNKDNHVKIDFNTIQFIKKSVNKYMIVSDNCVVSINVQQ